MDVQGVGWVAVTVQADALTSMRTFMADSLGLEPLVDSTDFALLAAPDGTMVELATAEHTPAYGYNDAIAFGFSVDDVEAMSATITRAGCELLGEIQRSEDATTSWRHFRAPDGRVYGLLSRTER